MNLPSEPHPAIGTLLRISPKGDTWAEPSYCAIINHEREGGKDYLTILTFPQPSEEELKAGTMPPPISVGSDTWERFQETFTFAPISEDMAEFTRRFLQSWLRDFTRMAHEALQPESAVGDGKTVVSFPRARRPTT